MSQLRSDLVTAQLPQGTILSGISTSEEQSARTWFPDWEAGYLYSASGSDGRWIAYRWDGDTQDQSDVQTTSFPTTTAELQALSYS